MKLSRISTVVQPIWLEDICRSLIMTDGVVTRETQTHDICQQMKIRNNKVVKHRVVYTCKTRRKAYSRGLE